MKKRSNLVMAPLLAAVVVLNGPASYAAPPLCKGFFKTPSAHLNLDAADDVIGDIVDISDTVPGNGQDVLPSSGTPSSGVAGAKPSLSNKKELKAYVEKIVREGNELNDWRLALDTIDNIKRKVIAAAKKDNPDADIPESALDILLAEDARIEKKDARGLRMMGKGMFSYFFSKSDSNTIARINWLLSLRLWMYNRFGHTITTHNTDRRMYIRSFRSKLLLQSSENAIQHIIAKVQEFRENFEDLMKIDEAIAKAEEMVRLDPRQNTKDYQKALAVKHKERERLEDYLGQNAEDYIEIKKTVELAKNSGDVGQNDLTAVENNPYVSYHSGIINGDQARSNSDIQRARARALVMANASAVDRIVFDRVIGTREHSIAKVKERLKKSPRALIAKIEKNLREETKSVSVYAFHGIMHSAAALVVRGTTEKVRGWSWMQKFIGHFEDVYARSRFLGKIEDLWTASTHIQDADLIEALREITKGRAQKDFLITFARLPFAMNVWARAYSAASRMGGVTVNSGATELSFKKMMDEAQAAAFVRGDLDEMGDPAGRGLRTLGSIAANVTLIALAAKEGGPLWEAISHGWDTFTSLEANMISYLADVTKLTSTLNHILGVDNSFFKDAGTIAKEAEALAIKVAQTTDPSNPINQVAGSIGGTAAPVHPDVSPLFPGAGTGGPDIIIDPGYTPIQFEPSPGHN